MKTSEFLRQCKSFLALPSNPDDLQKYVTIDYAITGFRAHQLQFVGEKAKEIKDKIRFAEKTLLAVFAMSDSNSYTTQELKAVRQVLRHHLMDYLISYYHNLDD